MEQIIKDLKVEVYDLSKTIKTQQANIQAAHVALNKIADLVGVKVNDSTSVTEVVAAVESLVELSKNGEDNV